jgi:hypothetical protein
VLSAKDFESLLPWYLNGTLTDREHALLTAYLKAHPEEDARVQWHASLRTCIKEQADELPEDLGRDRVLATVRQDISRAPKSQRTRTERHMAASVAAWADTLRRLRDTLGRWGTAPRVAALTCVALVVGAVAMLVTMTPTAPRAPVATVADSRTPTPTPVDRQAPAVAQEPGERPHAGTRQAPFAAKQIESRSGQPPRVARATDEPPGKRRPTQGLPQPAGPSTPPEPNESGLAAEGPPGSHQQETSPTLTDGRLSEPIQMATANGGATSPSSRGSGSPVPGAPRPTPGPEGESHTAHDTLTPPDVPASAQASAGASTAPLTASLPADRSNAREAASGRVALSGKTNTSCPSTNKQREDALRSLYPELPVRTPAAWLVYISELLKAGCRDAANREWIELHKKYPDEKAPPELEISK